MRSPTTARDGARCCSAAAAWGLLGDTWVWDGSSWTSVETGGPSPRSDHAMAYDTVRGRTVLIVREARRPPPRPSERPRPGLGRVLGALIRGRPRRLGVAPARPLGRLEPLAPFPARAAGAPIITARRRDVRRGPRPGAGRRRPRYGSVTSLSAAAVFASAPVSATARSPSPESASRPYMIAPTLRLHARLPEPSQPKSVAVPSDVWPPA